MRKWSLYFFLSVLILFFAFSADALAEEKDWMLSLGIKSSIKNWTLSKREYLNICTENACLGYDDGENIEKEKADFGLSLGPELVYSYKNFFVRGFYLLGKNEFEDFGDGERKELGFDIG